jgi:hypothetical protein
MTNHRRILWVGVWCLALSAIVGADTLVLRNGRRVTGELISVRDGVVDFRGSSERVRVDRSDVLRIELSDFDRDELTSGSGRPAGLRERDVTVQAATQWNDAGITVRAGQPVYFTSTGRVRWGPGRQDDAGGERSSPRNEGRPIPGRPAAGLIGRIGDSNEYFFIGSETGPVRMPSAGRLQLGINDDYLVDNSGSLRVTVFY